MTIGWKKIVRVDQDIRIVDIFNTKPVASGKMFRVRFPSGATIVAPAVTQVETLLVAEIPFVKIAERVFFAIQYEGLPEVWVRGIDVEVQEYFPSDKNKKKK